MLDYNEMYEKWVSSTVDDASAQKILLNMDENEKKDSFFQELVFGTAGLRGKLGMGTNRMNIYVVSRATQALANVIKSYGSEYMKKGVVFGYDSRIMSPEFANHCALIMASNGIKTYLFDSLRPTPEISFAVLYYKTASGVNITASHNPKEYNGYKVYWEEGSQIKDEIANKILSEINKLDLFKNYVTITKEKAIEEGILEIIGSECDEAYYKEVMNTSLRDDSELDKSVKIVYTPLNGAGNIPVREILKRKGFNNVLVVKEQEAPDGTFPTLAYPNPEFLEVFEYADKLALKENADIIIATDPDCDRVAMEVVHNGSIVPLNGNQTGVLMIDYLIKTLKEKDKMPHNPVMVKSIVTGEMGSSIARDNNVEMINVLTGFKNICALSNEYVKTKEKTYIFGYEESVGYNIGTFVRDKDGVTSSLFVAEMAAYYKKQGKTLIDVLNELFEKYGYYREKGISIVLEGVEGKNRIDRMMKEFRNIYPKSIESVKIKEIIDYLIGEKLIVENGKTEKIEIEKTNAVEFRYEDGSWYTLRPSGTEPKIKLYVYVKDNNEKDANKKLEIFTNTVLEIIKGIK